MLLLQGEAHWEMIVLQEQRTWDLSERRSPKDLNTCKTHAVKMASLIGAEEVSLNKIGVILYNVCLSGNAQRLQ